MKTQKNKAMRVFWLNSVTLAIIISIISCTPTEQYSDDIIGKWELITVDNYKTEPGFIWEFKKDFSYSILNNVGKFESDPFKSTPFRAEATFEGQYLVDSPKGMAIREKYRAPMRFVALEISKDSSSMEMSFYPITPRDKDETETVLIKFQRLN